MEWLMARRHFFDKGYPVRNATLFAGSEVLLAVSRHAVRTSHHRIASACLSLAASSERLIETIGRHDSSHVELRRSRENYARLTRHGKTARPADQGLEAGAGVQPGQRPACKEPRQR
jgi:hypothetical protein